MDGLAKLKIVPILLAAALSGCAGVGQDPGLKSGYGYERIAPDVYKIRVKENRFASTSDAEESFRVAAEKVSAENRCSSYRVRSYSRYLENAFPWSSIPVIEGEILCLH